MTTENVPNSRSRLPFFLEPLIRRLQAASQVSGRVSLGRGLRLGRGATIHAIHPLTVGNHVSVGRRSIIEVSGSIGNYCLIAANVQIVGRADHRLDHVGKPIALSEWVGDRAESASDRILIEDDVWVGAGAILLGGITVGEGSIIAAGAVVTKSVEPYSIVAGNPARKISERFPLTADRDNHRRALERARHAST